MATTETAIDVAKDAEIVEATGGAGPTAGDDFVVPPGVKQPRKSAFGVFREMPILVKMGVDLARSSSSPVRSTRSSTSVSSTARCRSPTRTCS